MYMTFVELIFFHLVNSIKLIICQLRFHHEKYYVWHLYNIFPPIYRYWLLCNLSYLTIPFVFRTLKKRKRKKKPVYNVSVYNTTSILVIVSLVRNMYATLLSIYYVIPLWPYSYLLVNSIVRVINIISLLVALFGSDIYYNT